MNNLILAGGTSLESTDLKCRLAGGFRCYVGSWTAHSAAQQHLQQSLFFVVVGLGYSDLVARVLFGPMTLVWGDFRWPTELFIGSVT